MEIRQTQEYADWFGRLRDRRARALINVRLRRLQRGNPGDVSSVGEGVSELRIHHGPGYRVYYVQRGCEVVVLLAGGDKSSQRSDISLARQLARCV
ncbi:MAG: type II toxin-antitoxin system RelE/ParE family toxin [Gammaproteobacteria bacterium]